MGWLVPQSSLNFQWTTPPPLKLTSTKVLSHLSAATFVITSSECLQNVVQFLQSCTCIKVTNLLWAFSTNPKVTTTVQICLFSFHMCTLIKSEMCESLLRWVRNKSRYVNVGISVQQVTFKNAVQQALTTRNSWWLSKICSKCSLVITEYFLKWDFPAFFFSCQLACQQSQFGETPPF